MKNVSFDFKYAYKRMPTLILIGCIDIIRMIITWSRGVKVENGKFILTINYL